MLNLKNTLDGYLKNVEVIGNTVQDTNNLADIRSVGDKVEGQELYNIDVVSCGKNFYNGSINKGKVWNIFTPGHKLTTSSLMDSASYNATDIFVIKPNTTFTGHINGKLLQGNIKFYDKNQCYLTDVFTLPTTSPSDAHYCTIHYVSSLYSDVDNIQLEYGTQATPYEPYQEQKLEILSPVQLEKVGNIADRIICKDGVWGVEKNIKTYTVSQDTVITHHHNHANGTTSYRIENVLEQPNSTVITSKFNRISFIALFSLGDIGHASHEENTYLYVRLEGNTTIDIAKQQLQGMLIKYMTSTPQFIPLPHDQQIKLRTFAGQTNVAFLTEIAGQIKAQVPKSLGATVNTHTEQIADLHNSLDRVKKLEETTVSTIETESNFTTVDATSNGYFEDVKLEGKTLVNLFTRVQTWNVGGSDLTTWGANIRVEVGKQYTLIVNGLNEVKANGELYIAGIGCGRLKNNSVFTPQTIVENHISNFFIYGKTDTVWTQEDANKIQVMVLEGDHTNNPPSYFEGLMSVGQDVEGVSVESVNENLISKTDLILNASLDTNGNQISHAGRVCTEFIKVPSNCTLYFRGTNNSLAPNRSYVCFYDKDKNVISSRIQFDDFKILTPHNCRYARFITHDDSLTNLNDVVYELYIGSLPNQYIHHQSNEKPLLYFNLTTETWEKPVLREWDTIEKHSDGKYYYHKRSGEVVLNGSENFKLNGNFNAIFGNTETVAFSYTIQGYLKSPTPNTILCDTFRTDLSRTDDIDGIYNFDAYAGFNTIVFKILKGKLSTQDVAGFKQWLKANPTKLVYKLEQEEVYECTNIDLMTYSGETNYIINSGAISPKSLLKVHNNISNVVKILQEKVSLLENTFIAGLKSVLSGDMYSLATILYPEDFEQNDNTEQDIMVIPE